MKLITGPDCKRLEFFGTHDEQSHANEKSKKLTHAQIVVIHDAVVIAPNQSATKLRRNLCQAKGSPESYKHMQPSLLRSIWRRVKTARDQLTMQQLDPTGVHLASPAVRWDGFGTCLQSKPAGQISAQSTDTHPILPPRTIPDNAAANGS